MSKRSTRRGHTVGGAPPHVKAGFPPALYALLQRTARERPPCLLCGGAFHTVGVFMPYEPERWGFRPGYRAARVYTLCAVHQPRPDDEAHAREIADRVEAHLFGERQRVLAARWN